MFGDDRSDEDQLGATYDELEWAMHTLANNDCLSQLSERETNVIEIYKRLNLNNQHKMQPIPVCLILNLLKKSKSNVLLFFY